MFKIHLLQALNSGQFTNTMTCQPEFLLQQTQDRPSCKGRVDIAARHKVRIVTITQRNTVTLNNIPVNGNMLAHRQTGQWLICPKLHLSTCNVNCREKRMGNMRYKDSKTCHLPPLRKYTALYKNSIRFFRALHPKLNNDSTISKIK